MDGEVTRNALEGMLEDGNAEPMRLPFSLLRDITDCFSDDRQIGIGGFARVYKGMVGHGMVAVKKLTNTHSLEETKFHKEVECLVKAKHKNIVRFLGFCAETQGEIADHEGKFVMSDTRNWLLCFEFVPNRTLDMYITDASSGLEWGKRFEIINGICQGLCYLHGKRILHLDLKPTNILMGDQMVPKIADFGLSRCLDEAQTRVITSQRCGTMGYLPIEFFRGEFAFTSDIYSLGVIIAEIITGEMGYPEEESVVESWMNRLEGDTQLEQVRVCIKIGIECMGLDPKKRPAARHIIDRLDRTSPIEETGTSGPSVELVLSLLKEQQCQHRFGETSSADSWETQYSEVEDVAERLQPFVTEIYQDKVDQWSAWGSRDTKQYQKHASEVSSSNSGPFVNEKYQDKVDQWSAWGSRDTKQYQQHTSEVSSSNSGPFVNEKYQDKVDQWSAWGSRDTKQYQKHASEVSSSNSGVFRKLSNLDIFNRKSQRNFLRNGGPIIQQSNCVRIFRKEELKPILVNRNIVGRGGFGDVYRGFIDNRLVAVRKPIAGSLLHNEEFANEVIERSQLIHRNILRLVGCCLEVDVPMLVYQFVSNGSLRDVLNINNTMPLDMGVRLRIAAQAADGLAYIKSEKNRKILYFGLGAENILLDDNFVPKISEFSRLDQTKLRRLQYSQTSVMTRNFDTFWNRNDVSMFGIIILELISRKNVRESENAWLIRRLLEYHMAGEKATELFDKEITATRDLEILDSLAEIAVGCLNYDKADERSKMAEVAEHLLILSGTYTG